MINQLNKDKKKMEQHILSPYNQIPLPAPFEHGCTTDDQHLPCLILHVSPPVDGITEVIYIISNHDEAYIFNRDLSEGEQTRRIINFKQNHTDYMRGLAMKNILRQTP